MTIDQNDWESYLLFDLETIPPYSLDDLFFQAGNNSTPELAEEATANADAVVAADTAADENVSSWIGDIESFLMQDDDGYGDEGVQNVEHQLPVCSPATSQPSSPVPVDVEKDSSDAKDGNCNSPPEMAETDADCPLSKKRIRQLRNRDAALRSRERKKAYVKELEMKSRYLEAECRRLGRLLQCCYAENHMLRVSFHSATAFSGSVTKAESAVLLLESLLLGSLLWLLVSMCLLPPPKEVVSPVNADSKDLEALPPRSRGSKLQFWVPQFFLSKRCRSSKTKMKVASKLSPSLLVMAPA